MRTMMVTTNKLPWDIFHSQVRSSPTIAMSSLSNGLPYRRLPALNGILLEEFFGGNTPNYLAIRPVIQGAIANSQCLFRIDGWRGHGNIGDRICEIRGTLGGARTSSIGDGQALNSNATSSWFCDTLEITKDYGRTINTYDAGGNNGAGFLSFDMEGMVAIAVNRVSTAPGGSVSAVTHFEATGW